MINVPGTLARLVRDQMVPMVTADMNKTIDDLYEVLKEVPKKLDSHAFEAGIYDEIVIPRVNFALSDTLKDLRSSSSSLVNPDTIYEAVPGRFAQFFSFLHRKPRRTQTIPLIKSYKRRSTLR